jgi:hypothetical protein
MAVTKAYLLECAAMESDIDQAGCCSSNALDLYSIGTGIESRT